MNVKYGGKLHYRAVRMRRKTMHFTDFRLIKAKQNVIAYLKFGQENIIRNAIQFLMASFVRDLVFMFYLKDDISSNRVPSSMIPGQY